MKSVPAFIKQIKT